MKNENNIFFFYLFYCNLSVLSIAVDVLLYLLNFKELEKNKKIIKNRDPDDFRSTYYYYYTYTL